ncbi:MAG TPA: ubiquinol oxidase subunit II [Steroidobacteraceae bacterium]|jgi:cytochrome o ubiquinol oxidase subunit 2|nr:ubiquinol oxidase subunit II [Steroidobacteraceae bacterium]
MKVQVTLFRRSLGPLVLFSLAGCQTAVLSPAGPVSAAERIVLLDSLVIMLAVGIPTIVLTLVFAYWFRASNTRARYRPDFAYSGRLELLVWSIPALVIFFLGGIAWISAHLLDPAEPLKSKAEPLEVQVVSLDWKWLFIYPRQNLASVNRMVVPVGVPLDLKITSASVFNVFFVPQLGSEIYAMYGMTSRLNLQADRPGVYLGLSAHFSGDGFPGMNFDVDAVPPREFADWVASARAAGPALDEAAYRGLLRQSQDVSPYSYRSVSTGLFEEIVRQELPPGEGPPSVRAGTGRSTVLAQR